MMFFTHIVAGFLVALWFFVQTRSILGAVVVVGSTLLPDIDIPTSKLGKKFKWLRFFTKHRGFFHSIFPMIIGALIFMQFSDTLMFAFLLGYGVHLFLDMLTKQGIKPLHPFNQSTLKGWFKTNSFGEIIVIILLLLLILLVVVRIL
jgi:membrane-bound metal-dependent hydrolase YbcI (DUF457 family)